MIAFVRTASIAPGKTPSALAFAAKVAAYVKSAYGVEIEVLRPIGGNPARVAWSARYENLAALEAVNQRMAADKKYQDMVMKGVDNWLPGSINDALWQTV